MPEFLLDPSFGLPHNTPLMVASHTTTNPENHLVIVQNEQAGRKLHKTRPGRLIYALGCPSVPYAVRGLYYPHLLKEDSNGEYKQQDNHYAILCPGNEQPDFNLRTGEFIRANADRIKKGEMMVTIHAMDQQKTLQYYIQLSIELGIEASDNFRILSSDSLKEGLNRRGELLSGFHAGGPPTIIFCTGGEMVNQQVDDITVCAVTGKIHELHNIYEAVREEQVVSLLEMSPRHWFEYIVGHRSLHKKPDRGNLANFATVIPLLRAAGKGDLFKQFMVT